jgi:hypothetical protein
LTFLPKKIGANEVRVRLRRHSIYAVHELRNRSLGLRRKRKIFKEKVQIIARRTRTQEMSNAKKGKKIALSADQTFAGDVAGKPITQSREKKTISESAKTKTKNKEKGRKSPDFP